jgi:hypothetical protein
MNLPNSLTKVRVLPSPFNTNGTGLPSDAAGVFDLVEPLSVVAPASITPRVEYNAIKLDKSGEKAQALYLTSSLPKNVIPVLEDYYRTNWVIDFGPYQLERVEAKPWDNDRRAHLSLNGTHIATARWGKEDHRETIRFDIRRCLENDGARIAKMVDAVAYVSKQLQQFAACPLDYAQPISPTLCGTSYGAKTLVQIDTLALKITEGALLDLFDGSGEVVQLGGYTFQETGTGGRMYRNKADVWFRSECVGTVLWGARMTTHEGFAKLELENRTLYNQQLFTRQTVEGLLRAIDAEVAKILRVDIAFDSEGLMAFLEAVHRRDIVAVRKMAAKKGKKYINLETDEIEGFNFGSRSAGRFARCYVKTLEIEISGKTYITKFHKKNGLSGMVCRLELELKSDFIRTVEGLRWFDVFDLTKVTALGEKAMSGWFDWVPADSTDSKRNRRERVTIVDFSEVKKTGYERYYPEPVKTDRTERIMIKQCILRAEAAPSDAAAVEYLQTAATLTEQHDLEGWLYSKDEAFARIIRDRAQLEGREIAGRFLGRSWYDVMTDAYENHQPVNMRNGEVASISPIVHYQAA